MESYSDSQREPDTCPDRDGQPAPDELDLVDKAVARITDAEVEQHLYRLRYELRRRQTARLLADLYVEWPERIAAAPPAIPMTTRAAALAEILASLHSVHRPGAGTTSGMIWARLQDRQPIPRPAADKSISELLSISLRLGMRVPRSKFRRRPMTGPDPRSTWTHVSILTDQQYRGPSGTGHGQ